MAGTITTTNTFASQTGPIPLSQLDANFTNVNTSINNLNIYSNYYADSSLSANTITVTTGGSQTVTYTAGLTLAIKVNNTNTGATTVNVNSLGAISLVTGTSTALKSGAITAGQIVVVIYDGTNFQLQGVFSGEGNFASIDVSGAANLNGTVTLGAGTANGVLYLNGSKAVTSGSALAFDGTNLTLGSTSQKFLADFTNATVASRLLFQTSTANSTTGIYAVPSGTATAASWQATNAADPTNASKILIATNGTTDVQLVSGINGTGTYLPLSFYTNGSQQMRLDTSGNLGLGVVPSAWDTTTTSRFMQVGRAAAFGYDTNSATTGVYGNLYQTGSTAFKYITSAYGGFYVINDYNGQHQWYTAASGTAGASASPTQDMTLDNSGNLLIANTSGGNRLRVTSSDNNGSTTIARFESQNQAQAVNITYGSVLGDTGDTSFGTSGNFNAIFRTNNTERARIDTSGNLLVGQTTAGLVNGNGVTLNPAANYSTFNHASGIVTGTGYLVFGYAGGLIGSITQNGTTGVLYNITSDYRLKNVVGAVSGSGDRIDALQPVEYIMKVDGSQHRGFLAHQFQAVYANSVNGTKDAVDADGKPVYQTMQASTSEVIADLVAEIQSLRARLKAANIP